MKKGFSFIECILAIGILSIIVISILPIVDTSFKQFDSIHKKNELRSIAQSTVELMKSNDELANELLWQLESTDKIDIKQDYIKDEYKCIVKRLYDSKYLMEVEVTVTNINKQDVGNIVLKASIIKR